MKESLAELLKYTFLFNEKVIDLLLGDITVPEKSLKLINHTINSQQIWNSRIEKEAVSIAVWDVRPTEQLKAVNRTNYERSLAIIGAFDLETKVVYTNSRGESFENTVKDILFHIINHSTYHRGQIATDCKMNDINPLVTDYIVYKREQI